MYGSLFLVRNYVLLLDSSGHFWSLSLEWQFYLIWPVILLSAGVVISRWVAILGALGVAAWRMSHQVQYGHGVLLFRTEVRADAILVGCLLALVLADPRSRPLVVKSVRILHIPALGVLIFGIVHDPLVPPLYECIAIAILLAATTFHSDLRLSRLLATPPLAGLGVVSYSVYVWQQFFTVYTTGLTRISSLLIGLPIAVVISYLYIELPSIWLGRKLIEWMDRNESSGYPQTDTAEYQRKIGEQQLGRTDSCPGDPSGLG